MAPPEPSARVRRRVAAFAVDLLEGVADPLGRGLQRRGWEHAPVTADRVDPATPEGIAVGGLLRLAVLSEDAAEGLREHPDPAVRRAAAVLAAHAHPLRAGLEAPGATT